MPTYRNDSAVAYPVGSQRLRTLHPGEEGFETPFILDHLDGVTRTSDAPQYALLRARHDIVFAGAGQLGVVFTEPHLIRTLLITSTVNCEMHLNTAVDSHGKRLLAGREYFLMPHGMVESLVFDALGAGTVTVEEIGPVSEFQENDGYTVQWGGENLIFAGQAMLW